MYGYLGGVGKNIVLGVDEVARVIRDVGSELQRRGESTPHTIAPCSHTLSTRHAAALLQPEP
jgi:hypothetical protein